MFIKNALQKAWRADNKPIVIQASVGSGKSLIARMIQLELGGAIVTPQNTLLRQYTADYPTLNYWWGKHNFKCHENSAAQSCGYLVDELRFAPCAGCKFANNKRRALDNEPTIFNPLSLYYLFKRNPDAAKFKVVVIDEAHAVLSMIMHMSGKDFDVDGHPEPEQLLKGYNLVPWLKQKAEYAKSQMDAYASTDEQDLFLRWEKRYMRLLPVIEGVANDEASYLITLTEDREKVSIKPIEAPQSIIESLFGGSRLILMSGTMFEPDIKELLGHNDYHLISAPNPIPAENRRILFQPTSYPINYACDRSDLAADIERIIDKYAKGQRTIVHLPYSWAEDVKGGMSRKVITHTKDTKQQALEEFKKTEGAILFACGMAEGIDLKGDLCRLNIIPKILWPNLNDQYVSKKRGKQNKGDIWYDLEALKTVIQQSGRTTRGADDWSITVVMDPTFPNLIKRQIKSLPAGFLDSIVWTNPQQKEKFDGE
jgi:Rad3-related DNA helicase